PTKRVAVLHRRYDRAHARARNLLPQPFMERAFLLPPALPAAGGQILLLLMLVTLFRRSAAATLDLGCHASNGCRLQELGWRFWMRIAGRRFRLQGQAAGH